MAVSTFTQSDASTQAVLQYPEIVDGDISVMARIAAAFAPHAQAAPNMTVEVDAGHLMIGSALIEVPAQATAPITAPASNPRIDRVVVNSTTGVALVVSGTEASAPTPPSIPAGNAPVAQVLLQPATTEITNDQISDERDFTKLGASPGALINVQTFATPGTYTYTPTPGTQKIMVEVLGGGGSGGSVGATNSSQSAGAGGGGSGAYAKSYLTSGFSGGVTVVVGAGGAASAAGPNNGNAGGTSSFGTLMVAPGGGGGYGITPNSTPGFVGGSPPVAIATGGNILNAMSNQGGFGFYLTPVFRGGGAGASSPFGGGGTGVASGGGAAGRTPGSGGGGAGIPAGTAAAAGGAGAPGIVIIHEYA